MDRRKIHKQLAKKIELESQIIKPKESVQKIQLNELNIKPSSTKSSQQTNGLDYIFERPPKFSISATNLKIKKAHSTTLSDFFSQQKESRLGLKSSQYKESIKPLSRLAHTSDTDKQQRRQFMKKQKNNENENNQNPINFYLRNSKAIVQHILKISDSAVSQTLGRNKIKSGQNVSSSNNEDSPDQIQSSRVNPLTQNIQTKPNSSLRNTHQLNPLRNLATLTQTKQTVSFQVQDISQERQQQYQQQDQQLQQIPEYQQYQNQQINQSDQKQQQQLQQQYQQQNYQQIQIEQRNIDSRSTINPQFYRTSGSNFMQSRETNSQYNQQNSGSRSVTSQKVERTFSQKQKHREDIKNPKKFYCLNSVGFKNYKYPRPIQMPYEKEGEKRTRMPLYLLPQSAPSKEIEDICINKYYNEVEEIEQSIIDKQQHGNQQQQQYNGESKLNNHSSGGFNQQSISQTQMSQDNIKMSTLGDTQIQDLEDIKKKYLHEIGYIQNKSSQLQSKRRFKSNAKYTFSDSKSKEVNHINQRSNKIEDISDTLCRNKNKIEYQIAKTKLNISKLQEEHSSYIQNSQMQQNKLQINQSIQQLYKDLVQQSDNMKQNHKYTEEYRQKLEEQDEEGVDADEYQDYNGFEEDEEQEQEESKEKEQQQYNEKNKYNNNNNYDSEQGQGKKEKKRSSDLLQKELDQDDSGHIEEETEEEFMNENSNYKFIDPQLQQQINEQEEYINNFLKNNNSNNKISNPTISQNFNNSQQQFKNPSSILNVEGDNDQDNLEDYGVPSSQEFQQQDRNNQFQYQEYGVEQNRQYQDQENNQVEEQENDDEEEDDQIKIHSLADFKKSQPLTDIDIIQKAKLGQLMMNILIDTFTVLKLNRPALRNRILLTLGLNPQDVYQAVPKETFEIFYLVLVAKTATLQQNIDFIIKFFKFDDDEDEMEQNQEILLNNLSKNKKLINSSQKSTVTTTSIMPQNMKIDKSEFKRILRLLTISIDEKTKNSEKNLYDYMIENLVLTEVIKQDDNNVDLLQFKNILLEGKINPIDIIDLISNLQ